MLAPGSKGWINKYFSLVETGEVNLSYSPVDQLSTQAHLHLISGQSGIIFGTTSKFIFFTGEESELWTNTEKLKVLLFETLLLAFVQKNGVSETTQNDFIQSLLTYYPKHSTSTIQQVFNFWEKEDEVTQLENILSKRINVSSTIFDSRWLLKSVGNVFVYLDVILYDRFINHNDNEVIHNYSEYAYNALIAILMASHADGIMDEKEEDFFQLFLDAANIDGEEKEKVLTYVKTPPPFEAFTPLITNDHYFTRYILDLTVLTIFRNHTIETMETSYMNDFISQLKISNFDLDESLVMIEHFLLNSDIKNSFLSNKNNYEKIYGNLTSRWTKILLRNKDKIGSELLESKELISLVNKSRTQELSAEEKEKVKTQFKDIIKTIPALTIFMLPGGAILLPIILKIIPDLIPSSFKTNEIE